MLTCIVLAFKMFMDYTYKNTYYAAIGGIDVREMNAFENKIFQLLMHRTNITRNQRVFLKAQLGSFKYKKETNDFAFHKVKDRSPNGSTSFHY